MNDVTHLFIVYCLVFVLLFFFSFFFFSVVWRRIFMQDGESGGMPSMASLESVAKSAVVTDERKGDEDKSSKHKKSGSKSKKRNENRKYHKDINPHTFYKSCSKFVSHNDFIKDSQLINLNIYDPSYISGGDDDDEDTNNDTETDNEDNNNNNNLMANVEMKEDNLIKMKQRKMGKIKDPSANAPLPWRRKYFNIPKLNDNIFRPIIDIKSKEKSDRKAQLRSGIVRSHAKTYSKAANNNNNNQCDWQVPRYWKDFDRCNRFGCYLFSNIHKKRRLNFVLQGIKDHKLRDVMCHSEWYIYRCRYWSKSISDHDSVECDISWDGSNDPTHYTDSDELCLLEDRLCVQNTPCTNINGPSMFFWTNNEKTNHLQIELSGYGQCKIFDDDYSTIPMYSPFDMTSGLSGVVDVNAALTPRSGNTGNKVKAIKNGGLKIFGDGAPDWQGIVCIDAYVPPLFRYTFYDNDDCLYYNLNRSNLLGISDHPMYYYKRQCNLLDSFDFGFESPINSVCNFIKVFKGDNNNSNNYNKSNCCDIENYWNISTIGYPSIISHSYYFNNLLQRTFKSEILNLLNNNSVDLKYLKNDNPIKNILKPEIAFIEYPESAYGKFKSTGKNKGNIDDKWTLALGFTHPRPVVCNNDESKDEQPDKDGVFTNVSTLLYKRGGIEIRIISKYKKEKGYGSDSIRYEFLDEKLEVLVLNHGGDQDGIKKLFSKTIRKNFGFEEKLISKRLNMLYQQANNTSHSDDSDSKFYFEECTFNSHILIITRNDNKNMKAILNGEILFDDQVFCLPKNFLLSCNSTHKKLGNYGSNKWNYISLAHKMKNDKSNKPINLFHGFIYSLSLYNDVFEIFELNEFYRMLRRHRDWHITDLVGKNLSNQLHNEKEPHYITP